MTISLYKASAPIFVQFLTSLSAVLDKAAAHAETKKIDPAVLLNTRLTPDMYPLLRQVREATNHAASACGRLAGADLPTFTNTETSIPELKERIAKSIDFIKGLKPTQIDGAEEAIRIDRNNPAVFHDRAILWYRKGALDEALVDLDRAIRFSFADANIYCDRGLVWYQKGRHDRAIADFNQAIKLDPSFAAAYLNRGLILHRNKEFNAEFAAVYPAIRVDPKIFDVNRRANMRP